MSVKMNYFNSKVIEDKGYTVKRGAFFGEYIHGFWRYQFLCLKEDKDSKPEIHVYAFARNGYIWAGSFIYEFHNMSRMKNRIQEIVDIINISPKGEEDIETVMENLQSGFVTAEV